MEELVRTNDPVLISFLESLMKEAGIHYLVADQTTSILDGSIGAIPRRLMVDGGRAEEARRIVTDAGLGAELRSRKPS